MKRKTPPMRRNRELAFQVLYGISFSDQIDEKELRRAFKLSRLKAGENDPKNSQEEDEEDAPPDGFAWELVKGVWQNQARLDEAIERFSRRWRIDRIGKIEHILLRLSLYELLAGKTPHKVVINEALELADSFGAENAKSFINGILDAAAKSDFSLAAEK